MARSQYTGGIYLEILKVGPTDVIIIGHSRNERMQTPLVEAFAFPALLFNLEFFACCSGQLQVSIDYRATVLHGSKEGLIEWTPFFFIFYFIFSDGH